MNYVEQYEPCAKSIPFKMHLPFLKQNINNSNKLQFTYGQATEENASMYHSHLRMKL